MAGEPGRRLRSRDVRCGAEVHRDRRCGSARERPTVGREAVGEVFVDGEGLGDAQIVQKDEAQAVDEAVALVAMAREVGEGGLLLTRNGPVDARELLAPKAAAPSGPPRRGRPSPE